MKLLQIDASPRRDSVSRQLTALFAANWQKQFPGGEVTHRDLASGSLPLLSDSWIQGAFSNPEQHTPAHRDALQYSDFFLRSVGFQGPSFREESVRVDVPRRFLHFGNACGAIRFSGALSKAVLALYRTDRGNLYSRRKSEPSGSGSGRKSRGSRKDCSSSGIGSDQAQIRSSRAVRNCLGERIRRHYKLDRHFAHKSLQPSHALLHSGLLGWDVTEHD